MSLCPPYFTAGVLWLAAERSTQDPISSSHQRIILWIKTSSVKFLVDTASVLPSVPKTQAETPLWGGHTTVPTKIFTDKYQCTFGGEKCLLYTQLLHVHRGPLAV